MSKYSTYSDHQLLALLKEGLEEAFAEIYDRYWSSMYAHVYKMLRDTDDTKDLLQDLFSSLWIKSADINVDTKLSGFLYIAARNRVFNLIQQRKTKNDYLNSVISFLSEAGMDTIDRLEERDLMAMIESEIQTLPPKMREIFELSRKENLSHKEIAAKLRISDQTVRKQIQNALRLMRPKFKSIGISMAFLIFYR